MNKLIHYLLNVILLAILSSSISAQTKLPAGWQSDLVKITPEGELIYYPDKQGNTIPDFSHVGYHHGDKSIPLYPITKVVYPLKGQDNRQHIQKVIDEVSQLAPDENGHRGSILLKRGEYQLLGSLRITTSGVVLMGEGDNINETRLLAIGQERFPVIIVSGSGEMKEIPYTRTRIRNSFIPVGSHFFNVTTAKDFNVGDCIIVFRPGTQAWIHDIQMDKISEVNGTRQWTPEEYNLSFERKITKIEGNRIYIDNPIVMQMENKYGGGDIFKYTFDGRIYEVGVSNMCIESEFIDYEDNNHGWIGVQFDKVENCWASNITCRYLGYSAVSCERSAKNVTVTDCRCLEAKAIIMGGLRYSFNNWGQQNLFKNCHSTEGRHDYVTGAQVCGPNVFYNCTASQAFNDIGPHHRWAIGTLYDNIVTDGEINVQDRGNWGTGHGWAGVTQVLWNCHAQRATVQNPWTSGCNYNIGMKGQKGIGRFTDRPEGVWEGLNEINIFPRSLYIAQLMARQHMDLKILIK